LSICFDPRDEPGKHIRAIAFYLTQFHPVPENDEWWGKGFTEWTNVTKATPLFNGHYQPHLPTDFGFYDLRVDETRNDQIETARKYGIDGFCYHYYWFSGRRLLNRPFDSMLADKQSDMPFCICWANENWTRRWDAAEHQVLIAQKYLPGDDLNFIKDLMPVLRDPRYIHVDGAPFLIVYRAQHLPDARKTAEIWREYCRSVGIPKIHICAALTHSGVEFPPHNFAAATITDQMGFIDGFAGTVVQFKDVAGQYLGRHYDADSNVFRTVFPSWDNTARRGMKGFIVANGTPGNYEYWLSNAIERSRSEFPNNQRLVFVNAWNEWAEGCHLEPDRRYGHAFLDATARAVKGETTLKDFPDTELPSKLMPAVNALPVAKPSLVRDLTHVVSAHGRRFKWAAFSKARHGVRTVLKPFPGAKKILVKAYLRVLG
jgi:lipopolysaccharide biosynthesis protein